MAKNKPPKPPKPTPDAKDMFRLAERYTEASALLEEHSRGDKWGSSAPKMLVESFAVELYLKCLYVQDTGTSPPEEHDWKKLFDALKEFTRDAIREEFRRIVDTEPALRLLPEINPPAAKVIDFEKALEAGRGTFDKRRYLYEPRPPGAWFYGHILKDAIRKVVMMDVRLAEVTKDSD